MPSKIAKTTYNITKTPTILQVLPGLMSGGVEREVVDTAEAIVKEGYKSFIASSGGGLVSQLYKNGSRHFTLELDSKNPITIIRNIFKLQEIIKFNDIDIIHAQSRAPAWSAYFATRFTKCHFITTIHGAHGISNIFKKLYNSVMTKGDRVIAVSEFIAEYARKNYRFDHKKLCVIHCGTDIKKFNYKEVGTKRISTIAHNLHIPTDKPILLLPGRLTRNKGHSFLLKAIKELPKDSVTCLFVGDYSKHLGYRKELQRKIEKYGLADSVIIINNVSDMPAIYGLADIVACLSTKPEAFGLISIEAQAMGRMVVGSDMGGIQETITDGKTGWLVEPNNVNQLTEIIQKLIKMSKPTRLKYSKAVRTNIEENFSLATMGRKIINTYKEVLGI